MEGQESTGSSAKKNPFEDLNRDELIQKCKGLLVIAQKAKQAKNELQTEIETCKVEIDKYKKEKNINSNNLRTLQELVDSLTNQKLSYITEVDSAQNTIKILSNKCKNYEEAINKYKADLIVRDKHFTDSAQKISDFDSEIVSLKRQNNRLMEENEQLINQLSELETQIAQFNNIGLEQRKQLQILENSVVADEVKTNEINNLNKRIEELENQLSDKVNMEYNKYENKITELSNLYELERSKTEKANVKLRVYKEKILKCSACITQLKNSRFILTKTVKEYSANIPKWQNDILKASKVLDTQIAELNSENNMLKEKLKNMDSDQISISIDLGTENTNLKEKINELEQLNKTNVETCEKQNLKVDSLYDECKTLKSLLVTAQDQLLILSDEKLALSKELSNITINYKELDSKKSDQYKEMCSQVKQLTIENKAIEQRLNELDMSKKIEIESGKEEVIKMKNEFENIQSELLVAQKQLSKLSEEKNALSLELNENINKLDEIKKIQLDKDKIINKSNIELNDIRQRCNMLENENKELSMLVTEKQKSDSESLNLTSQNVSKMDEMSGSYNLQIKALESEKAILVKEKLNARENVSELENRNRLLVDQVDKLKLEMKKLKADLDIALQEKIAIEKRLKVEKEVEYNNIKSELMTIKEQYKLLKKEHDNLQDLNGLLKEEVGTLKLSLEQPRSDDSENLSEVNVSLQTDIVKLETKLSAYKQENSSLLTEIKDSRIKMKEYDSLAAECEDAKSKLSGYKTENTELLNEMKEINQVLKERGEAISKLEKAIGEMERLIETLERDREGANQEKSELQDKIEVLENELKNVKQTTNKKDEVSEQIFFEKENALKASVEKDNIICSLKDEIEKLKLQQQQPPSDLPNEDMSTSTISRAEDNLRMRDLDETFEEKYSKLRMFALKLKKKLNETTSQLQIAELDKAKLEKLLNETGKGPVDETDSCNMSEISDLQVKVETLTKSVVASKHLAVEFDKLKGELETKSQQLHAEIEAHKATKENLDKARRDAKKKNVLSLEMEDYERSMKELTAKMDEKKEKMVQLESTIDAQIGTITAMKTQIKLLEEQIKSEESQSRSTKEELQHAVEEAKDKENIIQNKNRQISKLENELEDEKRKNEEADFEMTAVLSEKEKQIVTIAEEKIELNNKVKRLEFKCADLNERLRITSMELADLKTEYTSYKVRAQAVLRQNQTVDHSQEEQLKEETAALRAQIDTLTAKLQSSQEQCSELTTELESTRKRAAESSNEVARAQQRTARFQGDLTRISQQLDSERSQHKIQISTLTQCYKTQIGELEAKLQKETESLRKQLAAAQDNADTAALEVNRNQYMLPVLPKDDSDGELDINVSMIPREEGEGSESAPSPPPSKQFLSGSRRSPVPLERLLEEGVPEDEALDAASLSLTSDQEISELKRRLQAQQQRVKHVTVLLSESERECARMSQLSELLKAELRRVQGTTNSAHNSEYMKNVTLKFLTLSPGDERSRLVPVLQKILSLTPEEAMKVQAIAKGLDPNPKGWGSYLPWPGGK